MLTYTTSKDDEFRPQWRLSDRQVFLLSLCAYLLLAQSTILLNNPVSVGASFWPASGFSLALLLMTPTRQWTLIILGVALAEFSSGLYNGYAIAASILWTLGNCTEPLIGATLIRFAGNNHHGSLTPASNLLFFLLAAVIIAPLIGGSIGASGTIFIIGQPVEVVWPKYIIGDALGVLVIAPALLNLKGCKHTHKPLAEVALYSLVLVLMCICAFRNWGTLADAVLPFLLLPLLLWAALRFGVKGTALSTLLVANAANIATAFGYGPFSSMTDDAAHGVTILQIFLGIGTATVLLVATLNNELRMGRETQTQLREAATRDPLTGLYNRTGFQDKLEQLRQRRAGDGVNAAILVCDLDEFKVINDRFGHLAGDEVLKKVAACLQASLREQDSAARLGGDEFVVLLNDGEPNTVNSVAQRILDSMPSSMQFALNPEDSDTLEDLPVTISIGIATIWPGSNPLRAFELADKALYQAKSQGKARSVWASLTPEHASVLQ